MPMTSSRVTPKRHKSLNIVEIFFRVNPRRPGELIVRNQAVGELEAIGEGDVSQVETRASDQSERDRVVA